MNTQKVTAYKCGVCNTVYTTKWSADHCCIDKPKKVCEDCGCDLAEKSYFTVCPSCTENRYYNRCRKMTIEEYEREFPGNLVVMNDDYFYDSVYDCLETSDYDEPPKYVYGTKALEARVDIESAIERAEKDSFEDARFENTDELIEFVEQWNDRSAITYYEKTDIVIDIPDALHKEYMA